MDFWASSESIKGVSNEYFSTIEKIGAINALTNSINQNLPSIEIKDWKHWRVIFIILPDYLKPAFKETRRLTRRNMTLDFRVHVDYEASLQANFQQCIDLLVLALEKNLPYFKKAGIDSNIRKEILAFIKSAAEEAKLTHRNLD